MHHKFMVLEELDICTLNKPGTLRKHVSIKQKSYKQILNVHLKYSLCKPDVRLEGDSEEDGES